VQQRLQQRIQAARKADGGFTLIELLIVIVILGVLAGIVVFSVNFIQNRGTQAACRTQVKNVQTAVEAYYADQGSYPANLTALSPKYVKSDPAAEAQFPLDYDQATGAVTPHNGC
jgi:type II secretion system protein G